MNALEIYEYKLVFYEYKLIKGDLYVSSLEEAKEIKEFYLLKRNRNVLIFKTSEEIIEQ